MRTLRPHLSRNADPLGSGPDDRRPSWKGFQGNRAGSLPSGPASFTTPRYPPATWAREAEYYQSLSERRRSQEPRSRRRARLEWLVIVLTLALIVAALVFGIRL